MKIPRDLSGEDLAKRLSRFGYHITRQTGSHLRLTSYLMGRQHRLTIPKHDSVKIGTCAAILWEVARYLEMDREELLENLFSDKI